MIYQAGNELKALHESKEKITMEFNPVELWSILSNIQLALRYVIEMTRKKS